MRLRPAVPLVLVLLGSLSTGCARSTSPEASATTTPGAGHAQAPPTAASQPPAMHSPADGHADHTSFQRAAYLRDPQAYCAAIEPARCSAVAQPGPDVPVLEAIGGTGFVVAPGGLVTLAVQTDPGMPVSLTSFGLGAFVNGMSTVTVPADANGQATAVFQITPGTVGNCLITAGSPVRAGTVQFLVRVQP